MTALLVWLGIVVTLVAGILFIPYTLYERGRFCCADCPKEFGNRLYGFLHSIWSAFSLHKVVKDRRCLHDFTGPIQDECHTCSRCGIKGKFAGKIHLHSSEESDFEKSEREMMEGR